MDGACGCWCAAERITRSDATWRAVALRLLEGAEEVQKAASVVTLASGLTTTERPEEAGAADFISVAQSSRAKLIAVTGSNAQLTC